MTHQQIDLVFDFDLPSGRSIDPKKLRAKIADLLTIPAGVMLDISIMGVFTQHDFAEDKEIVL